LFSEVLMDYYQTIATASLILQIAALCMLFAGLAFKGRKKLRQHGLAMVAAVAVHTVLILVWMIPSFASLFAVSTNFTDIITMAIMAHAFTGIAADGLGIWLVASWRLRADMTTCFAKKGAMRVTIGLWLITMLLGILLYLKVMQIL
jgi:uncharacterized membrane protein YozB (DUF420 family)